MESLLLKTGLAVLATFASVSCGGLQSSLSQAGNSSLFPTPSSTPARSADLPAPPSQSTVAKARKYSKDKHGMPTYKDKVRTRLVRTTAYSHKENEIGAYGRKNAAGTILKYGKVRSAAADWSVYPLGTKFRIKGQPDILYEIDDYGSALVGTNTVDIFKPSLRSMNYWGTRTAEITIVQWGSYERSERLLKGRRGYSHCSRMYYAITNKLNSGRYAKAETKLKNF